MDRKWEDLDEKGKKIIIKIGKVAAKLFNRKNFLQVTMDEIAAAVKMSKGGLYYYFENKEKLLFFILNRHLDLVLGQLTDELERIATPEEKLKFFIKRHIRIYCENINEARLMLHEETSLSQKYLKIHRKKTKKYTDILRNVLKDLIGGNSGDTEDIRIYAYSLLGMCNWIYWWYDPKGPIAPEVLAEKIYRIFIGSPKGKSMV